MMSALPAALAPLPLAAIALVVLFGCNGSRTTKPRARAVAVVPPGPPLSEHSRLREPGPTLKLGEHPVTIQRLGVGRHIRIAPATTTTGMLPPMAPEFFSLVFHGQAHLLPLEAHDVATIGRGRPKWARIPRMLDAERLSLRSEQDVDLARLPMRWRRWVGRLLLLGKGTAPLCHARGTKLVIVREARVYRGTAGFDWPKGVFLGRMSALIEPLLAPKTRAWLALKLMDEPGQSCSGATWARDGFLDLPAVLKAETVQCDNPAIAALWPNVGRSTWAKDRAALCTGREVTPGQRAEDLAQTEWNECEHHGLFATRSERAQAFRRCQKNKEACDDMDLAATEAERAQALSRCDKTEDDCSPALCIARRWMDGAGATRAWELRVSHGGYNESASLEREGPRGGASLFMAASQPERILWERSWGYGRPNFAADFDGDGVAEFFSSQHLFRMRKAGKFTETTIRAKPVEAKIPWDQDDRKVPASPPLFREP